LVGGLVVAVVESNHDSGLKEERNQAPQLGVRPESCVVVVQLPLASGQESLAGSRQSGPVECLAYTVRMEV